MPTPKGYWIIQCQETTDAAAMQQYAQAWPEIADAFGARFIAGGLQTQAVEGPGVARALIIEFPSLQAALDCYHSPQYQQASAFALQAMQRTFVIVEGTA